MDEKDEICDEVAFSPEHIYDYSEQGSPEFREEKHSLSNPEFEIERDLTQKFLRGEITFADYSSEWYEKSHEEDEANDKIDDEIPSASSNELQKSSKSQSETGIKRRRRTHLPPALLGLMGEANLRFVRGDLETAAKMCQEIIRQVPTAAEPYQTLAQIHEHDSDKYLQYSLLAAHLSPLDPDEWLRLAEISRRRNEFKQEMICYTQAIKANPQNLSIHLKRIELLERLEENNYSIQNLRVSHQQCYHKIVRSLPPSESAIILDYAKKAASLYHSAKEYERALEVMKDAYNKCPSAFTMEDLNLLLELLVSQKEFRDGVEILIAHTGIEVEAIVETISDGVTTQEQTRFVACRIPDTLPIDLKSKLLICFIHLRSNEIVTELMGDFLQSDIEKMGDLFMDVEEALSAVGDFEHAFSLLELLVKSKHFSLGAVWLRHAECLINLKREVEAVNSLQKVIELAPQHVDARRKLFAILEKSGDKVQAINILEQDYSNSINCKLMLEYCQLLKEQKNYEKYLEVGEALLSRTFMRFRHPEELKMVRHLRSIVGIIDTIHNYRAEQGEDPYDENSLAFDEETLHPDQEWSLLLDLLQIAFNLKKYHVMQRLSFGAFTSKLITNRRHEVDFLCLQSCLLNKDYGNAYMIIKEFMLKFSENPRVWSIFNIIHQVDDQQNLTRYLMRISNKHIEKIPQISLLMGNSYLASGRYQMALQHYTNYHENIGKDPLSALLIGVTMLMLGCQKSVDKHHTLILQGMSYLMKYKNLRNYDQESYYNIARAFHMLSLKNLAVHYYEKALAEPSLQCEKHGLVDVKREAAFNLYLIYKASSPSLARMILQKYLVI